MAVAMVSFLVAVETPHPLGELTLEAAMSSIGAGYCINTLDTAPVQQTVLSSGYIANNVIDILTLANYRNEIKPLGTGHRIIDYNLRL